MIAPRYRHRLCLRFVRFSEALDFFRLLLIQARDLVPRLALCIKQFVKFGMNGLGVSVPGALDQQCHQPRGKRDNALPLERLGAENEPSNDIEDRDYEGPWASGPGAQLCQR